MAYMPPLLIIMAYFITQYHLLAIASALMKDFAIETHIINETINTKHNEVITIFFVAYLRDNKKFLNLNDLKIQIKFDITDAKEKLSTHDRTYCK